MPTIESREFLNSIGMSPAAPAYDARIRVIKNGYWFNQNAARVGYGDIAPGQLEHVAERLEVGQAFVVLPSPVMSSGFRPTWRERREGTSEDHSGISYVARSFAMLVVPECVYLPGVDGGRATTDKLGSHPTLSARSAGALLRSIQQINGTN